MKKELASYSIEEIRDLISPHIIKTGYTIDQIISKSRIEKIVYIRYSIIYILNNYRITDKKIGYIINRKRTSVISAKKTLRDELKYNFKMQDVVKEVSLYLKRCTLLSNGASNLLNEVLKVKKPTHKSRVD